MGELYNPYPKLPKNIRQIGERDQSLKLYVEDYVNTYLKRLYPNGGRDLRVGLLLGEMRSQEGVPYLFVDGALEMEGVTQDGEKVAFTEEAWKRAYQTMEQMFPRRNVLGWFLCGAPGCTLSPLNYWKQHGQYFSAKNQLMYLNSGLEGEEAIYIASEDGFYKLRGYCIYYERNQMMQDYMVSRKEAHRVESGTREPVIQDFRQKLEEKRVEMFHRRSAVSRLGTVCGVLSVLVLASGVAMFNNYHKMKEMESVIASVVPKEKDGAESADVEVEEVPGELYPTLAEVVIEQGDGSEAAVEAAGQAYENETDPLDGSRVPGQTGGSGAGQTGSTGAEQTGNAKASEPAEPVQVPSDAVKYVVKNGETLYGICIERYGSMAEMDEICRWNGLGDGSHIMAGQEILVPPVNE